MDLISLYVFLGSESSAPLKVRQKSLHFLEAYEKHLSVLKNKAPSILEIGCGYPASVTGLENDMGGSLYLWSEYFGKGTRVCGIDILNECMIYADPSIGISVEIGSQADIAFLDRVIKKHGPFDIIIDDGSHIDQHIEASFYKLFPYLRQEGFYIVEDINDHVKSGNSFNSEARFFFKALLMAKRLQKYSEMTSLQHSEGLLNYIPDRLTAFDVTIDSIHFYRDLIIFNKRFRERSQQMPMPPHYHY
jgi:preprotein translocase subunit SecB